MARQKKMTDATRSYCFQTALNEFYNTENGVDSKIELIKDILSDGSFAGKKLIYESVFGRPEPTITITQEQEEEEGINIDEFNMPIINWTKTELLDSEEVKKKK